MGELGVFDRGGRGGLFPIRVLIQLTRVIQGPGSYLEIPGREIIPLVRNLKEVSDGINRLTIQVEDKVKQTEPLFKAIAESAGIVSTVNRVLKGGVAAPLINMAGLSAGVVGRRQNIF